MSEFRPLLCLSIGQGRADPSQGLTPATTDFCKSSCLGLCMYLLSIAAFTPRPQIGAVATEVVWPRRLNTHYVALTENGLPTSAVVLRLGVLLDLILKHADGTDFSRAEVPTCMIFSDP